MTATRGTAQVARRTVVAAAGAVGLGAALAACGSGNAGGSDAVGKPDGKAPGGGDGSVLAKTSDIPEGGGKVFADQGVVVTQPTAGQFKAFSAICTHQGCTVQDVSNGIIHCPCHGSQFSVVDGRVKGGPALKPLPAERIKVAGDSITLA